MQQELCISAVGDISFQGRWADCPSLKLFSGVTSVFAYSDFVIGNLEGPLFDGNNPVKGKCTLRGSPKWARVLSKIGFKVLSIANNHIMDHGEAGLLETMRALEEEDLVYVGAGETVEKACAPAYVNVSDFCIAFLGRSSVMVSSASYATESGPGVAFFDLDETKMRIKESKRKADLVILLLHWGIEEYKYPSPKQRQIAKELASAGADLILCHHPHVLQGIEKIGDTLVSYSLGNFFFDEFWWEYQAPDGDTQHFYSPLLSENRKGGILNVHLLERKAISYRFIPTLISKDAFLLIDEEDEREKEILLLYRNLSIPFYGAFWKLYSLQREWEIRLRPSLKGKMRWEKLRKLRAYHFIEFLRLVKRSMGITREKTTNPYE